MSSGRIDRRALVPIARLLRVRLRAVGSAKIGRMFAWLLLVGFGAAAVWLRATDGPRASIEGLVTAAARTSAWTSAGLVAFAATSQRALADRRDGIEVLAATRGTSLHALGFARFVATGFEAARLILLPALGLGVLAISLAGNVHVAALRAAALVPLTAFGLVSGIVLGALAVASDAARPAGGRSLFLGLVILPWLVCSFLGHPLLSVPGALNGLLSTGLEVFGLGGLA